MYDVNKFRPLRIRAYLQSGVISDPYLPIDAILYSAACRDSIEAHHVMSRPGESSVRESLGVKLPIRKANTKHDTWFYKSSFAQWPRNTIEDSQAYSKRVNVKRTNLIDFGKKKGKIETARGRYKGYYIKVYYRHCLHLDWYVDGDKEAIERLLAHVTFIGKKASQGWGSVLSWQVEAWPEDWSVRNGQGELVRSVPIDKPSFIYGLRPSYWNPKHQFNVVLPRVTRFALR